MKTQSFLFIFLTSLFLLPVVLAADYNPLNFVSDYAEIIDEADEAEINALAAQIEQNTTIEVAVLTIPSLEGEDLDQFTVETFDDWGVGKEDVDNGLLMVVAVEDRKWRIEVGYGLEPVITDAMAGRIGRANFVDNFRAGDYGAGIHGALVDIKKIIENDPEAVYAYSEERADAEEQQMQKLFFLFVLFVIFTIFYLLICTGIEAIHKKLRPHEITEDPLDIPTKYFVGMMIFLVLFAVILFLAGSWLMSLIFLICNFILTFTRKQIQKERNFGGGGFGGFGVLGGGGFGGMKGRGGFGGFGGGGSGGGGAGGGW